MSRLGIGDRAYEKTQLVKTGQPGTKTGKENSPGQRYCLFKGWVVERQLATFNNPHYQMHTVDEGTNYRVSVNVFSNIFQNRKKVLSQVEFALVEDFCHPITAQLEKVAPGMYLINKLGI